MEDPLPVTTETLHTNKEEKEEEQEEKKAEPKTVFSILSNLSDKEPSEETLKASSGSDNDDIVILRRDPKTKRSTINKSAYLRLHRSSSPGARNVIDKIKTKYESDDDTKTKTAIIKRTPAFKLNQDTIKNLKEKYSPASYGYNSKSPVRASKLPVAKPRRNVKSQIIVSGAEKQDSSSRRSLNLDPKKNKDENSNVVRKDSTDSEEITISIVRQSDSEESVDRFERELSNFTMEKPEKKKRSNSFKKIFSGKIFGKDKKRKEDDKTKTQNKENGSCIDNFQNETNSFTRQSPYRHTTGSQQYIRQTDSPQRSNNSLTNQPQPSPVQYNDEIERSYAQTHINQFNQIKHNFENQNSTNHQQPQQLGPGYVPMDKPIFKCNQPTYMNMPNIRHIDTTSSSTSSTVESDRSNVYQNEVLANLHQNQQNFVTFKNDNNTQSFVRFKEVNSRETPPRLDETRCDVKLVNPKALIPISSERQLPNPYQNERNSIERETRHTPVSRSPENLKPRLEETYGTVLDKIENRNRPMSPKIVHKPPMSPSLEPTKLKLPPNRDIVPLSPRIRSPIPKDDVSTEKIIATELLKPSRSPTPTKKGTIRQPSPSHQRLADIDYPSDLNINRFVDSTDNVSSRPPKLLQNKPVEEVKRMSQASPVASNDNLAKRISQQSPLSHDKVTTNAMVHVNSASDRTPTPNSLLNRSMSPMRPPSVRSSTPVDARISQSPKSTPQKEEMRRNVEAYYWKEIKKLKDQETQDLYMYHLQHNMIPYGYAEDPVSVRRSRSLSPNSYKNSRRSLSLPRDPRQVQANNIPQEIQENTYGRIHRDAIPEGRAVRHMQRNPGYIPVMVSQNNVQNFRRNTPERRTVDGSSNTSNRSFDSNNSSLQRPIFKRGSLNEPSPRTNNVLEENKKVSFNSNEQHPWPTRNGYVKSPPQRRIDRNESILEDDVFLPQTPQNGSYGYSSREELYYNTRQNLYASRNQPQYVRTQNGNVELRHYPIEDVYGQPLDSIRSPQRLVRHGSINIDPNYDQRIPRRASFDIRTNRPGPRREIIEQDEIFGRFGGYIQNEPVYRPQVNQNFYLQNRQQPGSVYSSRQSVADSIYASGRYPQKQVSVNNKVCDFYGQIHDKDPRKVQSGVLVGQLNRTPASPLATRQSYNQLPTNQQQFVRNTRLTASANDMYRRVPTNQDVRYGHGNQYGDNSRVYVTKVNGSVQSRVPEYDAYGNMVAPSRPLPPVPPGKRAVLRGNVGISDTESSDASEVRRIVEGNTKTKKKGFFGK